MDYVLHPWQFWLIGLAGWINRSQREVIEYLRTEDIILRDVVGKKRILLIDAVTATPDELAARVCEAVQWAGTHRDLNPANAIIIYAWNEHDEGGWLQPTRGADSKADDSRIHALGKALRALQPPVAISQP